MSLFISYYCLWYKLYLIWGLLPQLSFEDHLNGKWFSNLSFSGWRCPWVSCRQQIDGSCVFLQSETLSLLIGSLSPFTFRVTIERYEFSVIMIPIQSLFLWIVSLDSLFLLQGPPSYFVQNWFGGHIFFQFLPILEALYLSFYSEWEPCWIEYSWLQVFPVQHVYYIMPLSSGLPSFCGEIYC